MIVQHNTVAQGGARALGIVERNRLKSLEKLSTGYRINRAADDAAGLAISEKMRAQIRGLEQAVRNVEDGVSYVQTADAALSEIHDILHRIGELAVESANDTNTEFDRECMDAEAQLLKEEVDRIFEETEFNTIKIWDTNMGHKVQIGTKKKQAVVLRSSSNSFTVHENNKGAIAYSGYTIEKQGDNPADPSTYGFKVTWEGWNKKQYSSELIPWPDAGKTSFGIKLSDYLDTVTYPELAGIDFPIGWRAEETATLDDIIKSVDGIRFSSNESAYESTWINAGDPAITFSTSIGYLAELASDRNVDAYDTKWIEPEPAGGPNVIAMPSYTDFNEATGWKLHFNMPNIGKVTAESYSVSYSSGNRDNKYENKWWYWNTKHTYKYGISYSPAKGSNGTLLGVSDCITSSREDSVTAKSDKGHSVSYGSDSGGSISVSFSLKPDNGSYSYEGRTNTSIGSITMNIRVQHGETEADIMKKLQATLNSSTTFDIYEGSQQTNRPDSTTASVYSSSARNHMIDVPVYKATHDLAVQAGANAGQLVHIVYDSLRLGNLGLQTTNLLTGKDATQAIAEIQTAEEIVSEQRSLFGAYQNRLEHAEVVDANTAENLQAAESRMRDVNMADEMVQLSVSEILAQAGQAMLAQSCRMTEGVLQLLR